MVVDQVSIESYELQVQAVELKQKGPTEAAVLPSSPA